MQLGIIGLPQTGKKTLFNLLAGVLNKNRHFDFTKPLSAVAEVQDPRFDRLSSMFIPKKEVRSRLEVILLPKIEEKTLSQGKILEEMSKVDAFCHVVRRFENDGVYHARQTLDPKRDIDYVNSEFILHDLLFIEKRLERIDKDLRKIKDDTVLAEKELLLKKKNLLESEVPLRVMPVSNTQAGIIASYPFLSRKELIIVLNVSDFQLQESQYYGDLVRHYRDLNIELIPLALKTEMEIAALDSDTEKEEFMKEMGISESALSALTKMCIRSLGLISFFTVGADEVRQWFIRKGSSAAEAAGSIHSDMQRGFIRAEVTKYTDLIEFGDEDRVKAAGRLYLKGKDYIVEDGDILGIRFSV